MHHIQFTCLFDVVAKCQKTLTYKFQSRKMELQYLQYQHDTMSQLIRKCTFRLVLQALYGTYIGYAKDFQIMRFVPNASNGTHVRMGQHQICAYTQKLITPHYFCRNQINQIPLQSYDKVFFEGQMMETIFQRPDNLNWIVQWSNLSSIIVNRFP